MDEFLTIASRQSLLSPELTLEISREAAARSVSSAELVLERGLLDAVHVDIVRMLARPRAAVPGYELLDVLGKGGMGVVFRARQLALDRLVALKTVLMNRVAEPGALARFEQEARAAGQLQHPHIVAAYDFGRHEGRLFLAMELIEGEDLATCLARVGRLSEGTTLALLRQAATGLAHAARSHIVHRDIKPANLMLVEPPEGYPIPRGVRMVKVADFGLAFLQSSEKVSDDRITVAGSTLGSPRYMAPEQIGDSGVDFRADIYALGATAYHMLAGVPPFDGDSLGQILNRKLTSGPRPLAELAPRLAPELLALVNEMMARDPADRPLSYASLIGRLDALSGSATHISSLQPTADDTQPLPAQGAPPATPARTLPGSQRVPGSRRGMFAVAGMLMLGLTLGLVALKYRRSAPPPEPPLLETTDRSWPLFNGEELAPWVNRGGQWLPTRSDEGERILAGQGMASCSLAQQPPLADFRLTLTVKLHEAAAVDLFFAPIVEKGVVLESHIVSLSPTGATLVRSLDNGVKQQTIAGPLPLGKPEKVAQLFHEIKLTRADRCWWVWVNNRPLGAIWTQASLETPEIRLRAQDGEAWFGDMLLEEMRPVKTTSR